MEYPLIATLVGLMATPLVLLVSVRLDRRRELQPAGVELGRADRCEQLAEATVRGHWRKEACDEQRMGAR